MKSNEFIVTALIAFTIAASPASPGQKASHSGIKGVAVLGPVVPVERPGQQNVRPLAGAIITVHPEKEDREIARAVADSKGRFKLALPPGTYLVMPLPPKPGRYPRAGSFPMTVAKGKYIFRRIEYDSGIR
jgi:hypothetical protein